MKILVCISNVPDTTTKVRFSDDQTNLQTDGIQWIINPWDELALTRALELKERPDSQIENITVITVGTAICEPTLRKALAIGADDAIRINADPSDAYVVAGQIAEVVKQKSFDIVLCGIESSDHNGSAVGGMLAEFLGYTSVSAVSAIGMEGSEVIIYREVDGGKEKLTVPVPLVAIVQKGIAIEPRIAAMRGIMMARQKPLEVIVPVTIQPITETMEFALPSPKKPCVMINAENVSELVKMLQNEAKVL
ncbi:MAG: electron transfer flavoprotein subunit beta/FixA family protein [Bacteroidales bacterium]|nr:electron transfer flavoprotein subunit beta/FixA family protein [Bacteroidales bacterium]